MRHRECHDPDLPLAGPWEKVTPEDGDYSELAVLLDGVNNLAGDARRDFLFDRCDIPAMLGYQAASVLIHNNDQVAKNYYLYRDTRGTGRWSMQAWDMDLTFGRSYNDLVLNDVLFADVDVVAGRPNVSPSHPLFGDSEHQKWDKLWNRLTDALQAQIDRLARAGRLGTLPPVLTFQSVVDFTVSTPAILTALYSLLPDNGSEIVLFDVNRTVKFGPLLRPSAYVALDRLTPTSPQPYRFTAIMNASDDSEAVVERSIAPGQLQAADRALNLPYPPGIFSLSHLAIPIPMDDPLYGLQPDPKAPPEFGFSLGAMSARGERGVLVVDQDFLTRLPSNPFFPYLLGRVDEGIVRPSGPTGRDLAATALPGIPVRLEALLSTFLSDDALSQPVAGP